MGQPIAFFSTNQQAFSCIFFEINAFVKSLITGLGVKSEFLQLQRSNVRKHKAGDNSFVLQFLETKDHP